MNEGMQEVFPCPPARRIAYSDLPFAFVEDPFARSAVQQLGPPSDCLVGASCRGAFSMGAAVRRAICCCRTASIDLCSVEGRLPSD